ncbi:MAG: hypothetical protein GX541_08315, partial [Clostridiales bacterium]|nr:hypothetical protein [Clostridiales bacterium]
MRDSVPVEKLGGLPMRRDVIRAVKVTLKDGRIDYIVYSTNNSILCRIDEKFDFRGFVGVYSVKDNQLVTAYVNDGDIIGDYNDMTPNITGRIVDFSRDLTTENTITISADKPIEPEKLAGRYIYVDNGGKGTELYNGCYKILSAIPNGANKTLDIGNTTLIKGYVDNQRLESGYIYNVDEGQSFTIPLSYITNFEPSFLLLPDFSVDAGSEIRFRVEATSPLNLSLSYRAKVCPAARALTLT